MRTRRTRKPNRTSRVSSPSVQWYDVMLWFCFFSVLGLMGGMIGKFVTSDDAASTRDAEIVSLLSVTSTNCTCAIPTTNATSPVTPVASLRIWLDGNWGNSSDLTYFATTGDTPVSAWNYHLNIGSFPNVFGDQLIPGAVLPLAMVAAGYEVEAVVGDGTGEGYWVFHGADGGTGYALTFLTVPTDGTALSYEFIGEVDNVFTPLAGYDGERLFIQDIAGSGLTRINTTDGATLESYILVDKASLGIGTVPQNRLYIIDTTYDSTTGKWWVLYVNPVSRSAYSTVQFNDLLIGTWDPDVPMTDNPTQYFITRHCYNFDRVISNFAFDGVGRLWFVDSTLNNPSTTSPRYIYSSDLKPCSEW